MADAARESARIDFNGDWVRMICCLVWETGTQKSKIEAPGR